VLAVVGNEGAACSNVFLDAGTSNQDIYMQSAGSGQRIIVVDMVRVMEDVPNLMRCPERRQFHSQRIPNGQIRSRGAKF
jgi:hypothetical protein